MDAKRKITNRIPAVAGKFYPSDGELLHDDLNRIFATAVSKQGGHVRAIVSPHAGYIFSGEVAASAFNQIDGEAKYDHIFLIASSHHHTFKGASVYCNGDFLMPYGTTKVDVELGEMLVERYPELFNDDPTPHKEEHSIEVQLPFLHRVMKTDYRIVPIILGTSYPAVCEQIAQVLKPYLNAHNLFVISTDFSHYPAYDDAVMVDKCTMEAIVANEPERLLDVLMENASRSIPNLSTSLCGWTSVLTLLYMTFDDNSYSYHEILYRNSGDAKYHGDRDRVVGYWAIALREMEVEQTEFHLTEKEKEVLLRLARESVAGASHRIIAPVVDADELSETLRTKCGAFVTLHKSGRLRGCIGRLVGDTALYRTVQEMAVSAAERDYRFSPVAEEELPDLNIEISVLSPLKRVKSISEIVLGTHGIYLVKGSHTGVFLPQVATETGWSKEDFLGHCARDKAGIGWDGWKSADIFVFTATVFGEV